MELCGFCKPLVWAICNVPAESIASTKQESFHDTAGTCSSCRLIAEEFSKCAKNSKHGSEDNGYKFPARVAVRRQRVHIHTEGEGPISEFRLWIAGGFGTVAFSIWVDEGTSGESPVR